MNWKTLLLSVFVLIFEGIVLLISWELGVGSLVLLTALASIGLILRKNAGIEGQFAANFSVTAVDESETPAPSAPESRIPGVDSSVFEQFRLGAGLTPISAKSNSASAAIAYAKANPPENQTDTFSEKLDDLEQVKVTLSKASQNLKESKGGRSESEIRNQQSEDKNRQPEDKKPETGTRIFEPEPLNPKPETALFEQLVDDDDDDLFADALIPLPGGERISGTELKPDSKEGIPESPLSAEFPTDEENLGAVLHKTSYLEEQIAEAEALLKLATVSCEAGRWEEAKAGLDSYLMILKELNREPSKDVLRLYSRLELPPEMSHSGHSALNGHSPSGKSLTLTQHEAETVSQLTPDVSAKHPVREEAGPPDYASVMDELVSALEAKSAYEEALPLLQDLLSYNRQRVNLSAMDSLYERIEQALASLGKEEDLVASYKEHLTIKQQLKDSRGEVRLLGLISSYYARTGDQKASQRYHTESLRVQAGLENKQAQEAVAELERADSIADGGEAELSG